MCKGPALTASPHSPSLVHDAQTTRRAPAHRHRFPGCRHGPWDLARPLRADRRSAAFVLLRRACRRRGNARATGGDGRLLPVRAPRRLVAALSALVTRGPSDAVPHLSLFQPGGGPPVARGRGSLPASQYPGRFPSSSLVVDEVPSRLAQPRNHAVSLAGALPAPMRGSSCEIRRRPRQRPWRCSPAGRARPSPVAARAEAPPTCQLAGPTAPFLIPFTGR